MRPRTTIAGQPLVEKLIIPQIFDQVNAQVREKTTSFNSRNEQEIISSHDNYTVSNFKVSDSTVERHENELDFIETDVCLWNEKNRYLSALSVDREPGKRHFSSALKMPNSPTNALKKSVRFADSIGHDLVHVKLFRNDLYFDDYFDLENLLPSLATPKKTFISSSVPTSTKVHQRQLLHCFSQRTREEINHIVEAQNVCIESINCSGMFVSGSIHVKNIAFEKQVRIRYTLDGWGSYAEMPSLFMSSNISDNRDTFVFSLCLPLDLPLGSCCEICVCYSAAQQTFWDNNNGQNYKLVCCLLPNSHNNNRRNLQSSMQHNTSSFIGIY